MVDGTTTSRTTTEAAARVGVVLLGLPCFEVLACEEVDGEVDLLVQTPAGPVGCPTCGVLAKAKERRTTQVRDLPAAGRPVTLTWRKRVWRCGEELCPRGAWTEDVTEVAPRAALTRRARVWACAQVGRAGRPVAHVAAELGVAWGTVMGAVREHGRPLVDDPYRLLGITALGVDETAFLRANARRHTQFVTGLVDLRPGGRARLVDVVPGRSGPVLAGWLSQRPAAWKEEVRVAALDPFRGYATALSVQLPHAIRVLDAFHVVKLGFDAVDQVRRRVQTETHGHRGRRGDPLYGARRVLRRARTRLSARATERLTTALTVGDPNGEVAAAWLVAQDLREVYEAPTPVQGRQRAQAVMTAALTCPVPEVARLGRTLRTWQPEWLAYFDTGGVSNGPTEAINLLIEKTRRTAHGYRNFDNYRLRLLLEHGVTWHDAPTSRIRGRQPLIIV